MPVPAAGAERTPPYVAWSRASAAAWIGLLLLAALLRAPVGNRPDPAG